MTALILTAPAQTREIVLTQGKVALVDAEDFDRLSKRRWRALHSYGTWYAAHARRATVDDMQRFHVSPDLRRGK